MVRLSIIIGILLTLLAVISYTLSRGASWTALIPAFVGVPLIVLGIAGKRESMRRHVMHAAVGLAMIGFLGSVRVLAEFVRILNGVTVERPGAVIAQILMSLACFIFVAFGVKSFVDARRKRSG
jgi:uncharacterized membrane protein